MKYRHVGLLSLGHLATDINQGALPAMLPFFIAAYDLSFAAAAGLVFAANLTSTIVQPVFGFAADRFSKPWILCAGLLLAGSGLALSGLFTDYSAIVALAMLSGIGIAAYHPQAARLVNFAAGRRKAGAMSIFGIGGTVGFAIGPLLITGALLQWNLRGTLVLLVPVSLMCGLLLPRLDEFSSLEKAAERKGFNDIESETVDAWWPFARLTLMVVGRSILFYGMNTFIPIYWIHVLKMSETMGATALTVMAVSGIAGNLLGGSLADKYGQKRVVLMGFGLLIVLMPVFVWISNALLAMALLVPIGICLMATYSPTIVLGQLYLPRHVGFSSGITLGVAIAIGGAVAPVLGKIADYHGVWISLASITFIPAVTSLLALTLPDPKITSDQR
ncbi:MAG: MFS transporter [Desulfobacteraceae bacterium]|jgi:FSR family fosmidomycin resistance protein-like MFS transporter